MGSNSVVPFQDLNLYPDPPTGPATATATPIVPKIEPKSEPLDELPPTPQSLHFSTPSPAPATAPACSPSSSEADVYSEYHRISELFRSAFAQRLQRHGDVAILPDSDPNSRAIVPVPNPETQVSDIVITPRSGRKYLTRSSELVRVTDLKPDDQRYFRDLIRKTRMLFDSLRVFATAEDEKRKDLMVSHRKTRGT
ncbi:UNVERIFIED_CONTAM: Histone-lysine N-methyltransferase family member SUVH9 [Sesamum latifolium]|uniref:Histone-lysine N-methyltransferase family member SUVH9 n=1 Tax=Sesamum latifolium TaxID=2727402 RepID=A0AAW2VVC4_9LAMI